MDVEVVLIAFEGNTVQVRDFADIVTDNPRCAIERVRFGKPFALVEAFPEHRDHRLAKRKTTAIQNDEGSVRPGVTKVCILRQTFT